MGQTDESSTIKQLKQEEQMTDDGFTASPVVFTAEEFAEVQKQILTLAAASARRSLAGVLGKSYDGDRDRFDALGYKKDPTPDEYRAAYDRTSVAGRIVDLPASTAWKRSPVLFDGKAKEEGGSKSKFVGDVDTLNDKRGLWARLADLDRVTGIGEFGIMVIGTRKTGKLSTPLTAVEGGVAGVTYLRTFDQSAVTNVEYDNDEESDRFGLPVMYTVDMGRVGGSNLGSRSVHWSRVIHVAENGDEVFGRSRLQRPYNRLEDLERVVGASSEAAWRLVLKGAVIEGDPEYDISGVAEDYKNKADDFVHGFERTLVLQGAVYRALGGEIVDPTGLFNVIGNLLATDADIPRRILFGTEEAQLAGSADQENWVGQIKTRQTNHVEPNIIRAFLNWAIRYKVVNPPVDGVFAVVFPEIFEERQADQAATMKARVEAIKVAAEAVEVGAELTPAEIRAFGLLPPEPTEGQFMATLSAKHVAALRVIHWAMKTAVAKKNGVVGHANGDGPVKVQPRGADRLPAFDEDEPAEPTEAEIMRAFELFDLDFPTYERLQEAEADPNAATISAN